MTSGLDGMAAIIGVGFSPVARRTDRTLGDLALEAALDAVRDAGIDRATIDGCAGAIPVPGPGATYVDGIAEVSSRYMASALGLADPTWVMDVSGMIGGTVVASIHALASGLCRCVVITRALAAPATASDARPAKVAGAEQFTLPYGLGAAGGRFALWLQRYMHDHGATREELYRVAAQARASAQANPFAVWRGSKELALDEYLASRWLYQPMCLFDADMPIHGAGALVLTTAERAGDLSPRPAYITGYANAAHNLRAFEAAGIQPRDVQVAQLYDGFSPMVWLWLEKLGLCETGAAHRLAYQPELPALNTFGGALGEGRLHGMGHLREAALQAMGRADARGVPEVHHSLVQVGIPEDSWIFVMSPQPHR